MAGGIQEATGARSELITSSIVMIRGRHRIPFGHAHVGLTKHRLFVRDRHVCAYCGDHYLRGRTHRRAHPSRVARRPPRVDQRRHRLPLLQHPQGQPSSGRSEHAAAVRAVRGVPQRRLHPQQSPDPRRPDGVPADHPAAPLALGARLTFTRLRPGGPQAACRSCPPEQVARHAHRRALVPRMSPRRRWRASRDSGREMARLA